MAYRVDARALLFFVALPACEPWAEAPAPAVAPVVQNITYTTNVYVMTAPATSVLIEPAPAPALEPRQEPTSPPTAEIPVSICDAYFEKSRRCIETLTTDRAVRARFERALGELQRERRRQMQAGDEDERAAALTACAAALHAYEDAPCGER